MKEKITEDQSDGFTQSEICSVVNEIDKKKRWRFITAVPSPHLMLKLFAMKAT